jgi:hypothetical protein
MFDFLHGHVPLAVLLGASAIVLVLVWGYYDQRRDLAARTGRLSRPIERPADRRP